MCIRDKIKRDENGEPVEAIDGGGVWTDNYYDLPVLIGEVLVKFLDDNITPELYETMDNVVAKYTQEAAEKRLAEIYEGFVARRVGMLESALVVPTPPVEEK